MLLEDNIVTFVKNELKNMQKVLSPDYPESLYSQREDEEEEQRRSSREAFLQITLFFLRQMKQDKLADRLQSKSLLTCQHRLKSDLKKKFQSVFEGIAKAGQGTLLNEIYTELHITEGGTAEVNEEHEVRQIEAASRRAARAETSIRPEDVELEGWVRLWENPNGIPEADIPWLKEDTERGLFTPVQVYKDSKGLLKRRQVMKLDRMWFYPPDPPGYIRGGPPTPQLFFRSRVFVWRPVGVWRYSLKCPRGDECVGRGQNVHLYKSGYHHRVRHICDVSNWYTVITEVLCCGACTKAARSGRESGKWGRWLAWDPAILSQLSEAHQAMFPAILTSK
nr:PREDICTED: uncharacterized protein LOC103358198 [Stegastes partitus]